MATIEPIKKTIVQEQFILTLERAELEDIVRDPRPWVNQWRAVLKQTADVQTKARRNGHVPKAARKTRRAKAVKPGVRGGLRCKWCAKRFTQQGWLDRPETKCDKRDIGTVAVGD